MTDNDHKALALLARLGVTRAGAFGEAMSESAVVRYPQCYARSGCNVLRRLVQLGYAEWYDESDIGGNWGWRITAAGRRRQGAET